MLRLATMLALTAPTVGITTPALRGGLRGGRYPRSPHSVLTANALTSSHVEDEPASYETATVGVMLCPVHDSECIVKARALEKARWAVLSSSTMKSVFTLCGLCLGAAIVMAIDLMGLVGELLTYGPWLFCGKFYDRRA